MSVYDALVFIIARIENNTSCGMLDEKTRNAKNILQNYVLSKLVEDKNISSLG